MELQAFRTERLLAAGIRFGLSTLVASSPANINYLSGGYRSVAQEVSATTQLYVLLNCQTKHIAYVASVAEVPSILVHAGLDIEIFCYGPFQFYYAEGDTLAARVRELAATRYASAEAALTAALGDVTGLVGLDEGRVGFSVYQCLLKQLPAEMHVVSSRLAFLQARSVKHPEEIRALRASALLAEGALREALSHFQPGMTALEMQLRYCTAVTQAGGVPYFFVATAGARAAFVDTVNTPAPIRQGDMIRFDFGCILEGYYSDLARTATVGSPGDEVARVYSAVCKGRTCALEGVRSGITAHEIFCRAEEGTACGGLPGYLRSHCGHGIGLEGYDNPSIARGQENVLETGMVLCIETPYYRVGWGGVQIENTIVVQDDGMEFLDSGRADLIVL